MKQSKWNNVVGSELNKLQEDKTVNSAFKGNGSITKNQILKVFKHCDYSSDQLSCGGTRHILHYCGLMIIVSDTLDKEPYSSYIANGTTPLKRFNSSSKYKILEVSKRFVRQYTPED